MMLHGALARAGTLSGIASISVLAIVVALLPTSPAMAAPLAPTGVTADRGAANVVTVAWTAASGIDSYTVKAYQSADLTTTWDACTGTGTATSCNGVDPLHVPRTSAAWIQVSATTGGDSTAAAAVKIEAYPGEPTISTVTSGDGSLAVSWTASADGSTANQFTANAYAAVQGGSALGTPCAAASSPCTITGLTNGTVYYVGVVATRTANTDVGIAYDRTSDESARVSGTPAGLPSAPVNVTAGGGDSIISVGWAAPTSTGGSPITDYVAEAYTAASGGTVADSCQPAALSSFACTLEAVTNGTTYYVTVSATNDVGYGAGATRIAVQPGSRPTTPRSVTVLRGDGILDVTWTAPASDGGSAITQYTARAYTSTLSNATAVASCTSTVLTCRIAGVTNATTYYVSVTATTLTGDSPPSSRVTSRAVTQPTAPLSVTATSGNGFSVVNWRAPLTTGGARIEKYVARAFLSATNGDIFAYCSPKASELKCTLGPLPNGTTYYIDVIAVTAQFTSPASSPRVAVLPSIAPEAPRQIYAAQEGTSVRVRWRVPASDGGQSITRYTATAYSSATGKTKVGSCTTDGDTCLMSDLTGPPVYVAVSAENAVGASDESAPRVKVVLDGAPSPPRDVAAQRSASGVKVTWLRSVNDGGSPITSYVARVSDSRGKTLGSCTTTAPRGSIDTRIGCTIPRISGKAAGGIFVSAVNVWAATDSQPTSLRAETAALVAPTALAALSSELSLVVSASRGADDPDGSDRYVFHAWSGKDKGHVVSSCTAPRTAVHPTCTITGLHNYVKYWVDAVSERGSKESKPTARVLGTPMASVPSPPLSLTVTGSAGDASIHWTAPVSDGGYAITKVIVTAYSDAEGKSDIGTCTAKVPKMGCSMTLTEEYAYFIARAVNPVGTGQPSATVGRNLR